MNDPMAKCTIVHLFYFLIAISPCSLELHNLSYRDLEETGASCLGRDSCASGVKTSNCECDSQCQWYDDCCIDAKLTRRMKARTNLVCQQDGTSLSGAYAINQCRNDWMGPAEIRQKCETISNMSDPVNAAPVTDVVRSVTYRNLYCSNCNNVDPTHLRTWNIRLSCDSLLPLNGSGNITYDYINSKITYRSKAPYRNKWGIYHWDNNQKRENFFPCDIDFEMPKFLGESVRVCRPTIISECDSKWRLQSVRRKCKAYMAVIYINSKVYRNPHCAQCNNEQLSQYSCAIGAHQRIKPAMSFRKILEVNLTKDEKRCKAGEFFDTYYKRCRKQVLCPFPNQVYKNGRCVIKED